MPSRRLVLNGKTIISTTTKKSTVDFEVLAYQLEDFRITMGSEYRSSPSFKRKSMLGC